MLRFKPPGEETARKNTLGVVRAKLHHFQGKIRSGNKQIWKVDIFSYILIPKKCSKRGGATEFTF